MRLTLVSIAIITMSVPARSQRPATASVAEQYLFSAANAERVRRGIPALLWSDELYQAANGHAHQMAARRSISHQYVGEADLSVRGHIAGAHFSKIAENVAESPDVITMQEAWMQSPGHRANLLDPDVDGVGIRVISREGELYGVEDFQRSVTSLSLDGQERIVGAQIQAGSTIVLLPWTESSRLTCGMERGYAGEKPPGFVMRYTTSDLSKLPEQLQDRLASGHYRQAIVGACAEGKEQDFTVYRIGVMLFP